MKMKPFISLGQQTTLYCATILLLALFITSNHCQLFERSNELSYNRLHPSSTDEIQQCLSPDLEEKEKSQCRFFAAVIDAGSTGTRLHLFEFSHDTTQEPSIFKLEAETYKELKPGVSCFAKTPELAAENVRQLLMVAKKQIPQELWEKTPLSFKATAGVRLLSEKEADSLLSHIEHEIMSSELLVDDDAVGLLSGTDEGVFGWFTLNFLLERLDDALEKKGKSAAALDLGGGSTQVTFVPTNFDASMRGVSRQKYSHRLKIFDKELRLYTHSYLGNGLIASRLGIAKLSSPEWDSGSAPTLKTHCLPKKFVLDDRDYAGNAWLISATPEASFETCLETATQYVTNLTNVKHVPGLANEDIHLFGYFYDRGVQGNVIPYTEEQTGGQATVGDYRIAAEQVCAIPTEAIGPEPWRPWQCLDLTYIYALLHHGYGLPDEKTITLSKKIRSMEVSWALGAGFHLLNSYHENNLRERQEQRQRDLEAALKRDREVGIGDQDKHNPSQSEELEQRWKLLAEKEEAAERRMASLLGAGDNLFDQMQQPQQQTRKKSAIVSALIRLVHWFSDRITHLLKAIRLIS